MDTRRKILKPSEAVEKLRGEAFTLVTGYFDVLQPRVIRSLAQASGETVVVLVLDPPKPVMSARARAELAASLRAVSYVIPAGADAKVLIAQLNPPAIRRLEQEHEAATEALIERVLSKNNRAQSGGGH